MQKSNKVGRRKLGITRWKPNDQNSKKKKDTSQITTASTSHSNAKNSNRAIPDQQTPNDSRNVVDQDGPPKKKQRKTRRKTKPEEKRLLEPLVTCSEYPTNEQLNQVEEALGNEWDKNRICQYISRYRRNKNNNHE